MQAAAFCRAQQLQRCTHSLPAPFFFLQSTPARCSAHLQLPPHCSFPSQASTCQSLACFPPNIPLNASATALAGEGHLPSPQSSYCRRGWSRGSSCQESSLARRLGTMAQSTAPSSELPFPILPPSYDLPHPIPLPSLLHPAAPQGTAPPGSPQRDPHALCCCGHSQLSSGRRGRGRARSRRSSACRPPSCPRRCPATPPAGISP